MDNYEEYKNTLLHETWFRRNLNEKYRNTLAAEKDYIDSNGVLWKVGLLGAVCGFIIALTPIENGNWILGIISFLAIMGSIILALHIGKKFKKDSGEMNFYAYLYNKHFEDRLHEDRRREMYNYERELSKTIYFMQWRVNNPSKDPTEVLADFRHALHLTEDLKKQYEKLTQYDGFVGRLKDDYHFNAEIQNDIDKYF